MSNENRSKRRSDRSSERIAFARDQRRRANEFSQVVWQMVSVLNRIEAVVDERIGDNPSPPAPLPPQSRGRGERRWFWGGPDHSPRALIVGLRSLQC